MLLFLNSIRLNQKFLFFAAVLLDPVLPPHSLLFCIKLLTVYQGHRCPALRVLGAFLPIMAGDPLLQIICPSCIQSAVTAPDNIRETAHASLLHSLQRVYRHAIFGHGKIYVGTLHGIIFGGCAHFAQHIARTHHITFHYHDIL